MHEMGITQGILSAAFEAAEEREAVRITEIRIQVGELTEIVEFALQFAFDSLTPGTLAEGGKLVVEHIAPRSKCTQCGEEFEHGRFDAVCPGCGNPFNEIVAGRELLITGIAIETADDESGVSTEGEPAGRDEEGGAAPGGAA